MFEWTGAWSDDSSQWTPELLREMNYTLDVLDGTFWIAFVDFLKYFVCFEVCLVRQPQHQRPWTEVRRKLWVSLLPSPRIESASAAGDSAVSYSSFSCSSSPHLWRDSALEIPRRIPCMFILHVTSQTPTEMYFSAHQPYKVRSESNGSLYIDIGVTVLRIELDGTFSFVCSSGLAVERQIQASAIVEPGLYIVIPMTSGTKLKQYHLQRESAAAAAAAEVNKSSRACTDGRGAVQLLDEHREERFSEAVDAVFDEIFDRFDSDRDGVRG